MNSGFRGSAGQRLARTGKNLTGPGGRRRGPGGNGNTPRRNRRDKRLSGSQRRPQRGGSRSGWRNGLRRSFAGGSRRSLRYRFVPRSRIRTRGFGGRARFGCVLRRCFRFRRSGGARSRVGRPVRFSRKPALDLYRDRFIDRAGVGFLFRDAQLRKHVEDHVGFHLELARQLVDSNFDHTVCPAVQFRHRGCQIKPCSLSRASAPAGASAISIVTDCCCSSSAAATGSAGAASPSPPDSNCP